MNIAPDQKPRFEFRRRALNHLRRLLIPSAVIVASLLILAEWPVIARSGTGIDAGANTLQGACDGVPNTPFLTIVYGTVALDSGSAPTGTVVTAVSPRGDLVGCFEVLTAGHYGMMYVYGEDSSASPPIPGMREGETVGFRVNGLATTASPLLVWHADAVSHFAALTQSSFKLDMKLNVSEPVRTGDPINLTITVTNTGNTWIGILPLASTYDTRYLTYGFLNNYASPASRDNINDGTINWSDLTVALGADLAPGKSLSVGIWFTTVKDTTRLLPDSRTPITVTISGALADPDGPTGPLVPSIPLPTQQFITRMRIMDPTALHLEGLAATPQGDRIYVRWSTGNEASILGFNVLRAQVYHGVASNFTIRNAPILIASYAGSNRGEAYAFADENVEVDTSYRYMLEVIKLNGTVEVFGPVEASLAPRHLYMPMIALY